jgi:hypothetical protein
MYQFLHALSRLHRNQISRPISCTLALQAGMSYMRPHVTGTERMGFLKQDACGNLVVDPLPVKISPFHLLPKVSGANVCWTNANHTFLTHKIPQTDTFLCDISPAKLRSTAQVRNPQGISKLVNKVDCWVPCALLKAIVRAFLATKSFAMGSSTYPCHMACISKSVPRDVISSSNCHPQRLRSAMDMMCNNWGRSVSIPFLCSSGFSGA